MLGKKHYEARELEQARLAFLQAERLDPGVGAYLANLGTVELALGLHRDAADHLAHALAVLEPTAETEGNVRQVAALQESLARARAEVTTLSLDTDDGVTVLLDGTHRGITPLPFTLHVTPGRHMLRLQREGYDDEQVELTGVKGKLLQVTLRLSPLAATAPPPEPARSFDAWWLAAPIGAGVLAGSLGLGLHLSATGLAEEGADLRLALSTGGVGNPCFSPAPADAATCDRLAQALSAQDGHATGAAWSAGLAAASSLATGGVLAGYFAAHGSDGGPFHPAWLALPAGLSAASFAASLGLQIRGDHVRSLNISHLATLQQETNEASPCAGTPAGQRGVACAALRDGEDEQQTLEDGATGLAILGVGAMLVTGAMFTGYVLASHPTSPSPARSAEPPPVGLAPWLGPELYGLLVHGGM